MKKLKYIVVWPWPLWSCLLSGGLAVLLRCPEIWGGGDTFLSYVIPFPVASGTFHIPTLVITTVLLYQQLATSKPWPFFTLMGLAIVAILFVAFVALKVGSSDPVRKQAFVWFAVDPIVATAIAYLIRRGARHNQGLETDRAFGTAAQPRRWAH